MPPKAPRDKTGTAEQVLLYVSPVLQPREHKSRRSRRPRPVLPCSAYAWSMTADSALTPRQHPLGTQTSMLTDFRSSFLPWKPGSHGSKFRFSKIATPRPRKRALAIKPSWDTGAFHSVPYPTPPISESLSKALRSSTPAVRWLTPPRYRHPLRLDAGMHSFFFSIPSQKCNWGPNAYAVSIVRRAHCCARSPVPTARRCQTTPPLQAV